MRIESNRPLRNGGWLHKGGDVQCRTIISGCSAAPKFNPLGAADFEAMLDRFRLSTNGHVADLAIELGVPSKCLKNLDACWSSWHQAFAFPMRNEDGRVIGIRLRRGKEKRAVKGSKNGLFVPVSVLKELDTRRCYICEGPTDTAALLSLGVFAIGRPACVGAEEMTAQLLRYLGTREVVLVTDNDAPGLRGAEKLAGYLRQRKVFWVPPAKDARDFVTQGGTKALLEMMIGNAVWKL